MTEDRLQTFRDSLDASQVECVRTEPAEFEDTLRQLLDNPAVGAWLPFEDISLEGTPVTVDPTPAELTAARTGVTGARFGIADYGSVVLESGSEGTEQVSLYPDHHVAVLRERNVLPDMAAAFDRLSEKFASGMTSAVIATGPSLTADMGELVYGAHGPESVSVVLLGDG